MLCLCIHGCLDLSMQTRIYKHTFIHTYIHTSKHTFIRIQLFTYSHTWVHTNTHTHTHTHIYIYICIHKLYEYPLWKEYALKGGSNCLHLLSQIIIWWTWGISWIYSPVSFSFHIHLLPIFKKLFFFLNDE